MLQKKDVEFIINGFEEEKSNINADKISVLDNKLYLKFLSVSKTLEINPDLEIFGYEDVIRENAYFLKHYAHFADSLWLIGWSGQGDQWFLSKKNNRIVFYDHDKGEYEKDGFLALEIDFGELLQMGDLCKQLESKIDALDVDLKQHFIDQVYSISENLLEKYPYKYW